MDGGPRRGYAVYRALAALLDGLEGRPEDARARLAAIAESSFDAHITFHLSESFAVAGYDDSASGCSRRRWTGGSIRMSTSRCTARSSRRSGAPPRSTASPSGLRVGSRSLARDGRLRPKPLQDNGRLTRASVRRAAAEHGGARRRRDDHDQLECRIARVRPTGITFLAVVNYVACIVTLVFWALVFFGRLVPTPGSLQSEVERANAAVTYGFMLGDVLYSVPLLLLAGAGLGDSALGAGSRHRWPTR